MSWFYYYLPGVGSTPGIRDLAKLGIGYAFEGDKSPTGVGCYTGPDCPTKRGEPQCGLVIAAHGVPEGRLEATGEHKRWIRIPGAPGGGQGVWVGVDGRDPLPGPLELARGRQLRGHTVRLGDGREWLVPVARETRKGETGELYSASALPQKIEINADGQIVMGDVVAEYRGLWEIAEEWRTAILDASETDEGSKIRLTLGDAVLNAARVLGTNYRVSMAEASLLGLFDTEMSALRGVLNALLDIPSNEALLKKKLADVMASSGGGRSD